MGFADGFYYGQGKIIIDTTGVAVDTVYRVRSVTQPTKMWHVTVATSGTPLVVEVPGKDYYKICLLEDVGGTPTESTAIYRTIDYGQTIFAKVLDKTTLGGIQGILNAHQEMELLNIGDEVTITVDNSDWVMQIADIDLYEDHEVIFVSKYLPSQLLTYYISNYGKYTTSELYQYVNNFYNRIAPLDRNFIKEMQRESNFCNQSGYWDGEVFNAYTWAPMTREVQSDGYQARTHSVVIPKTFGLFSISSRRIKSPVGGSAQGGWFTGEIGHVSGPNEYLTGCNLSGNIQQYFGSNGYSLPCFHLTADV